MTEEQIINLNDEQLWTKRHEIKTALKQKLSYNEMDMVEDLLTIERETVRREK